MPKVNFRQVYNADYGRGYGAVEILANLCYIALFIYACFSVWASKYSSAALIGLLYVPIPALVVYIIRLILRAIFAWRDKLSNDIVR